MKLMFCSKCMLTLLTHIKDPHPNAKESLIPRLCHEGEATFEGWNIAWCGGWSDKYFQEIK